MTKTRGSMEMYAGFMIELREKGSFLIKERAKPGYKNIFSWLWNFSHIFLNLHFDENKENKFCTKYY